MAERDKVRSTLGGHDARHLRHSQHVPLRHPLLGDEAQRLRAHRDLPSGDSHPLRVRLPAHVHHANAALLVYVCQFHSTSHNQAFTITWL